MDAFAGTLLAFVALEALAFFGLFRAVDRERASWAAERSQLLDRIMAKNYTDFVYTTKTVATDVTAPPEPPDTDWHRQNMKAHPDQYPDGEVWE